MAASKTISLSTVGSGGPPEGVQTTGGPLTDTVATPVLSSGTLVLSTSLQAIAVPSGATNLILTMASGNAINITIAGDNSGSGLINTGSGWTWQRIAVLGGTQSNVYVKAASGTPSIFWEFC